jgi:uncharacterized protein YciI
MNGPKPALFVMTAEFLGQPDDDLLADHIAWLTGQFEAGTFLLSGGLGAAAAVAPSALAIMQAPSREHALALLDEEPMFRAGKVRHEVRSYEVRVASTDLDERLVGQGTRIVPSPTHG